MAGGIDELLDVLYGMVEEAWSIPLGKDKCVIEREKVLDLLDEIRGNLPNEIKAAREIVEKRNEIVAAGKKEADSLKLQSEEKARQILNQNEIVIKAKEKANEIINVSEAKSRDLKVAASTYCDDVLKQTEDSVNDTLAEIKKLRAQLKNALSGER